ncbi:MAG: hypothetical protein AAF297_10970, partial [Planctomycetota bacterium]
MRHAAAIASALCAAMLAGCLSVQPAELGGSLASEPSVAAHADTPELDDEFWPARWGDDRAGSKGIVIKLDPGDTRWRGSRIGRFHDQ